jgi:hypothetical protein
MTWMGILENLVADALFVAAAILFGWIYYALTNRTKLLGFFGVGTSRRLLVYLSKLNVVPGGATDIVGVPRSYQGHAVAFGEMSVANRFRDLFNYLLPSLSEKPGILSKLLISDVQVELLPSPLAQVQVEHSASFITLGGPAYNVASKFVETQMPSQASFRLDSGELPAQASTVPENTMSSSGSQYVLASTITTVTSSAVVPGPVTSFPMGEEDSQVRPNRAQHAIVVDDLPPFTDATLGFVERIVDHKQKRCVFYAAGLSELGTVGAADFLLKEWRRLHRKYGSDTSFVVLLSFEASDYKNWSIAFERERVVE